MDELIREVYKKFISNHDGKLASYIPELAKVEPELFAIAITVVLGKTVSIGDSDKLFTLQSTSKPVVYSAVLAACGEEFVHSKVGVEPTGEVFNSIIELEEKSHRPFNPMINSGSIAVTSLVRGLDFSEKLKNLLSTFDAMTGHEHLIDENVFESERKTGHRNRAIANLMKHFGVIESDVEETLNLYFKQCSIQMNCSDLSLLAATYANGGRQPVTGLQIFDAETVRRTLSLMFTCGMYNTSGEWAFRVGLPAKSGVSGALFAIVPGRYGIAVYSPRIDERGHSVRGQKVIEFLSKALKAHVF